MKIAYVTDYDAKDITKWSGLGYYIWNSLSSAGASVDFISNIPDNQSFLKRIFIKLLYFNNRNSRWFMAHQNETIARNYASYIQKELKQRDYDCIFSPIAFNIAFLETDKAKVFYTDATFQNMLNYYPNRLALTKKCIERGHMIERKALSTCSLAIYSSNWAAQSAIDFYGADPRKIRVVPFGANLNKGLKPEELQPLLDKKKHTGLNLLFVGVDWKRKGGEAVLQTCIELEKRGIAVELNVVGVRSIPGQNKLPSFVKIHGCLQKSSPANVEVLDRLFKAGHFLFVPSKADCSPVVFAEAAAYGLPVISIETGGISEIVKDGQSGVLLKDNATPAAFADIIISLWKDEQKYNRMSVNALSEYNEKLNWSTNGQTLLRHIKEVVQPGLLVKV